MTSLARYLRWCKSCTYTLSVTRSLPGLQFIQYEAIQAWCQPLMTKEVKNPEGNLLWLLSYSGLNFNYLIKIYPVILTGKCRNYPSSEMIPSDTEGSYQQKFTVHSMQRTIHCRVPISKWDISIESPTSHFQAIAQRGRNMKELEYQSICWWTVSSI